MGPPVYPDLSLCAHLRGEASLPALPEVTAPPPPAVAELAEVQGQEQAKRALIVAAAGGHNLLLFGPPGTGKTLLASRLPGILPPLREQEALEVAAIQSVCERTPLLAWPGRPFRAPHHGASAAALVGGGSHPRPGEVSQAHNGVLFLDELPEFDRKVLEMLREPLESGSIHIARAREQLRFPARFQLVAAMNPCPCGYAGDRAPSSVQIPPSAEQSSHPLRAGWFATPLDRLWWYRESVLLSAGPGVT